MLACALRISDWSSDVCPADLNEEINSEVASRRPYGSWGRRNLMSLRSESSNGHTHAYPGEQDLDTLQQLHGYTHEELEYIIRPMAEDGKEAVGSMGDDPPLSEIGRASCRERVCRYV